MKITKKYLLQLFDKFRNSTYGKKLSCQLRYGIFKPKDISFEEWVFYLGPNGNNLEHMVNTYNQTIELLKNSDLATDQKDRLYLAALIHGCGESIVGDVNYLIKTKNDELEEEKAFKKILSELVHDTAEQNLILDAYIGIAMEPKTKLGEVFNAVERIGYISDAFRMGKLIQSSKYGNHNKIFRSIIDGIVPSQTEKLIEYSKVYSFVAKYLQKNKEEISTMSKYIDTDKNNNYRKLWASYIE